jgi:hypothetical protein
MIILEKWILCVAATLAVLASLVSCDGEETTTEPTTDPPLGSETLIYRLP